MTATNTYTPLDQLAASATRTRTPTVHLHLRRQWEPHRHDRRERDLDLWLRPLRRAHEHDRRRRDETSYSYDLDGNVTGITYPLGAGATWASSDTVTYGYDHADRADLGDRLQRAIPPTSPTPPTACPLLSRSGLAATRSRPIMQPTTHRRRSRFGDGSTLQGVRLLRRTLRAPSPPRPTLPRVRSPRPTTPTTPRAG